MILLCYLLWLLCSINAAKNIPASEYDALRSLFYSTNGSNWLWRPLTFGQHWKFPLTGEQPNPCVENWQGINCSSACFYEQSALPSCHVIQLRLPEYHLRGTLPQTLGNLSNLVFVDLSYNDLFGTIPSSIGMMTELISLQVVSNPGTVRLTGTIPTEIYSLHHLALIDLGANDLTGTISSYIGNLSNLFALFLDENRLSGPVPSEVGLLSILEHLSFLANRLTSTIPYQIQNMSRLREIDVSINGFTGSIPTTIGQITTLEIFWAYNNSLTGHLPEQLSRLKRMQNFAANFNSLTGSIPSSLAGAVELRYLWLQGNSLSGSLPSELALLNNCSALDLGFNCISGTIPSEFGVMVSLTNLNLVYNLLTGTIPSELGLLLKMQTGLFLQVNITKLSHFSYNTDLSLYTYVNLGLNMLHGSLPPELGLWKNIDFLLVYFNFLTGGIPTEFGNFTVINTLDLDSNLLSGTIPTQLGSLGKLATLSLGFNRLTGTLPAETGRLSNLYSLDVQSNKLAGTLPATIKNLSSIRVLSLSSNSFSGTIPSILDYLSSLRTLLLANNNLHGELEPIFAPLTTDEFVLNTVDLSNNNFYGSLPSSIFALKKINSISLIKNCFHGEIPLSICNASRTLSVIALDGLTAGSSCDAVIFSFLHTYTSKYMKGSLPVCVFDLPGLVTLQMSGNGLTGTLPAALPKDSLLRNVSLSNNRLGGTIPTVFQKSSLELLDLANNRFSGTINDLENFFDVTGSNATVRRPQLALNDNRFSGNIPSSFQQVNNINVVGGNFFGCKSISELPQNDPATGTAECGSNTLDLLLISFAAGFTILGTICVAGMCIAWRHGKIRWKAETEHVNEDASMAVTGTASSNASVHDVEVIYFTSLLPEIRRMVFLFAIPVASFVLLPLYLLFKYINDAEYSTHTYQYGLTPSIAFLEGEVPLITFWTILLVVSLSIVVLFGKMNGSIRRKADDISRRILSPRSIRISWDDIHSIYAASTFASAVDSSNEVSLMRRIEQFCMRPTVLNATFVCFNVMVFFVVNGCFVYIILTFGQVENVIAQIVLVAFKLAWNQFVIPDVLHRINSEERSSSLSTTSNSLASVLSSTSQDSLTGGAKVVRYTVIDLNTMLVLFNTIVIPIILVMVESFDCYYYAFKSQDAITLVQYYKACREIDIDGKCVPFEHHISTSFIPPFIYNFGCSNAVLINYTSVFVLMYIYLGLASPLLHLSISFVMFSFPGDSPSCLDRIVSSAEEYANFLSNQLGSVTSESESKSDSLKNSTVTAKDVLTGLRKLVWKYCVRKYRSVDKIVCRLISDFAVLFTFGMAYPPLAVIVCLSVYIESFEWILMMTRNNQLLRQSGFAQDSNHDNDSSSSYSLRCQGVINLFGRFRWVLVTMLCWFFGFILFDMSGGTGDLSLSLCSIIFFWPFILYCGKRSHDWYRLWVAVNPKSKGRPASATLPAMELQVTKKTQVEKIGGMKIDVSEETCASQSCSTESPTEVNPEDADDNFPNPLRESVVEFGVDKFEA